MIKRKITNFLIPVFYSIAMVLVVLYAWNGQSIVRNGGSSPLFRNLTDYPAYIRQGFDPSGIQKIPLLSTDPNSAGWVRFESRPLAIFDAPLPDLPKRPFLSPWGRDAEEFTILIAVEIDSYAASYLNANPSVLPGIYFATIGENWEIYLNGVLVNSEMHWIKGADGKINILEPRSRRDLYFPIDRNLIVSGTNILALRIAGDPTYVITGLPVNKPNYMDNYKAIETRLYNPLLIVLSGIFGFVGFYYLMLYLSVRNRQEIFYLYFSFFSILLCIFTFCRHDLVNRLIPNGDIAIRLELGALQLFTPLFGIFIETVERKKSTLVSKIFLVVGIFITITQILFSNQYGEDTVAIWNLADILYIFYILFYDIVYFYFWDKKGPRGKIGKGVEGSLVFNILIGVTVVCFCAIYEILEVVFFHNSLSIFQYGIITVHIGMTFTLSQRFSGMYKQLEQSNVMLETAVQERTRELEEQTAIAVGANRAKSEFLANMSHEIRTPMNSIVGFTELALDSGIPTKTSEYLSIIKNNSLGLLHIIDDILDLSKVEYGKLELERIPFDLQEVLSQCQSIMMTKAHEKSIELRFKETSVETNLQNSNMLNSDKLSSNRLLNNLWLLGDPLRLRQVLLNIISNAIKFTDSGFVEVLLSVKNFVVKNSFMPEDTKILTMQFTVQDSGTGMSKEQIDRIFEPFTQADSSITRRYGGTGLGLSISKSLIELMGGELTVESRPGEGSTFSFELAFGIADNTQVASSDEASVDVIEKPMFDGEVLVCEDNPWNRQLIVENLTKVGLRVTIAENGMEGVNLVRQRIESCKTNTQEKPFGLVLMDIQMPVMDGLEAALKIAQIQQETSAVQALRNYPKTPIVAMTANVMPGDLERYKKYGMDGCLGKPFSSKQLWRCLLKFFDPVESLTVAVSAQEEADRYLQKRFYKNFLHDNKTKFAEISEALKTGDVVLTRRLLHTLGGHAALIGKTDLQKSCLDMEESLKAGETPSKYLDKLKKELDTVLEEVLSFEIGSKDELHENTPLDEKQAMELLKQLQDKLEKRDPLFINMIDDIRAIPGTEELVSQMENYLIKQALVTVTKLIEDH